MSYQLKVSLAFYFYGGFILVFCLIATWRVPSERLTAVSVDLQCGSSAHLLPSLLSLQQVPREPRWTRASVSRSSSWQEPRPCLPVVNGGQRAPPTRRLRPDGCRGELSQPPRASPSPRPPCALRVSPPQPRGGGGLLLQETGRGEAARTHVPQKLHPPLRPAPHLPERALPGFSPPRVWSCSAAALGPAVAAAASSCLSHTLPVFAAQRAPPRGHAGLTRAQPSWDPASLCSCCEPALLQALSTQALPGLKDAPTPPATVPQARSSCHRMSSLPPCSLITSVSSLSLGDGNARRSRNGVQAQP